MFINTRAREPWLHLAIGRHGSEATCSRPSRLRCYPQTTILLPPSMSIDSESEPTSLSHSFQNYKFTWWYGLLDPDHGEGPTGSQRQTAQPVPMPQRILSLAVQSGLQRAPTTKHSPRPQRFPNVIEATVFLLVCPLDLGSVCQLLHIKLQDTFTVPNTITRCVRDTVEVNINWDDTISWGSPQSGLPRV